MASAPTSCTRWTVSQQWSSDRSSTATLAPACARRTASAAPIPRPAPVTRATRSCNVTTIISLSVLMPDEDTSLAQAVACGKEAQRRLIAGQVPLEAREAAAQVVARGDEARRRMIEANLRLVVSIARYHAPCGGLTRLDVIQEGNLGLFHALEKFDHHKGC